MKALKLFPAFVLTTLMGLAVAGCGGDDKKENPEPPAAVVKTALKAKIDAAQAILDVSTQGTAPGQYSPAAMTAFTNAISAARTVYNNTSATQTQVDGATATLNAAITTFQAAVIPTPPVSKTALQTTISQANTVLSGAVAGFSAGNYRQKDKNVFQEAIAAAQAVYDDPAATQTQVDNAVSTLNTAKTAFQSKVLTQNYDQYLSLHLKMDGNAGDESYYQHTATLYQRSGSSVPQPTADRFGAANKAYAFSGNQINILNDPSLIPSVMTVSLWIKPESVTGAQAIFSMNWWDGYYFKTEGTQMLFQSAGAGGAYIGTWTNVEIGTWYHVAIVRSTTAYKIYVNGVLDNEAEIAAGTGMTIANEQPLVIGALSFAADEYPFNGAVDEFRLYSKVLSETEIQAIYNAEKP